MEAKCGKIASMNLILYQDLVINGKLEFDFCQGGYVLGCGFLEGERVAYDNLCLNSAYLHNFFW